MNGSRIAEKLETFWTGFWDSTEYEETKKITIYVNSQIHINMSTYVSKNVRVYIKI